MYTISRFRNIMHSPNGISFITHEHSSPADNKTVTNAPHMAKQFFVMW